MSRLYIQPDDDLLVRLLKALFPGCADSLRICRLGEAAFDVLVSGVDQDGQNVSGWLPTLALDRTFPGWADQAQVTPGGVGGDLYPWKVGVRDLRRAAIRLLTCYVVPTILSGDRRDENSVSAFSGDGTQYKVEGGNETPETWLIDE